jgi:hypothetical protein
MDGACGHSRILTTRARIRAPVSPPREYPPAVTQPYASTAEIDRLLACFAAAEIPPEAWNHRRHLTYAADTAFACADFAVTLATIRAGIVRSAIRASARRHASTVSTAQRLSTPTTAPARSRTAGGARAPPARSPVYISNRWVPSPRKLAMCIGPVNSWRANSGCTSGRGELGSTPRQIREMLV